MQPPNSKKKKRRYVIDLSEEDGEDEPPSSAGSVKAKVLSLIRPVALRCPLHDPHTPAFVRSCSLGSGPSPESSGESVLEYPPWTLEVLVAAVTAVGVCTRAAFRILTPLSECCHYAHKVPAKQLRPYSNRL